jgi:hypothetical protein
MKYRKKPVVIEAFQMTESSRRDFVNFPEWLDSAFRMEPGSAGAIWPDPHDHGNSLLCGTLEGDMRVSYGDFIIQGVQGEIYPCKPDIFEQTYEPVEAPSQRGDTR